MEGSEEAGALCSGGAGGTGCGGAVLLWKVKGDKLVLYIRYEILENGNLKLAENVEKYSDLTKKEWQRLKHESDKLKYENLDERFAICRCDDMTALLFMQRDGTLKLVEKVEKCLELSDTHWWSVRVKCQGVCDFFPVRRAEDEGVLLLYLETLASQLHKKKLLVKSERTSYFVTLKD